MDLEQSEGESKFWNTPELVKKLVSLLDPVSTLGLVQSEMLNKQILQKSLSPAAWNQLISSSYSRGLLKKKDLKDAVTILKLINLEDPSMYLLPLLDVICRFFPGTNVEVICTCQENHHTMLLCICYYAYAQFIFSCFLKRLRVPLAQQSIKSISTANFDGQLLTAVVSRMSRQKEGIASVNDHTIFIQNKSDAHAFTILLQAQAVYAKVLQVSGPIGGHFSSSPMW